MEYKDRFYLGWERAIAHLSSVILPIINDKNGDYEKKCKAIKKIFDDSFQDVEEIILYEIEKKEKLNSVKKYVKQKSEI
jgi:hypothetical protein